MSNKHKRRKDDAKPDPESTRIDAGDRKRSIELRAYYLHCEHGRAAGSELDDWLRAERELLAAEAESEN